MTDATETKQREIVVKPQSTAPDVRELKEQLRILQRQLNAMDGSEVEAVEDKPLKEPVVFYNPRYRWERFAVPGRTRKSKFMAGVFHARTENEAVAIRKMNAPWIFEGNDRREDDPLTDNKGGKWLNSQAYAWHMKHRAL